jgi:hypothetical protein
MLRNPEKTKETQVKLPLSLRLTQTGCMTSWPIMAVASFNSWCVVATHEHASSALPTTCLQLVGRDGMPG